MTGWCARGNVKFSQIFLFQIQTPLQHESSEQIIDCALYHCDESSESGDGVDVIHPCSYAEIKVNAFCELGQKQGNGTQRAQGQDRLHRHLKHEVEHHGQQDLVPGKTVTDGHGGIKLQTGDSAGKKGQGEPFGSQ